MNPHRGLLHHLNLLVFDFARSRLFYGPMFQHLGYELIDSNYEGVYPFEDWGRWELDTPHIIAIGQADKSLPFDRAARMSVGRFTHLAFGATDRADVDRFYAEVLVPLEKAGLCVVEDPPCDCPEYGEGYYATFFFDPDGIKYEYVSTPGYLRKRAEREKHRSTT